MGFPSCVTSGLSLLLWAVYVSCPHASQPWWTLCKAWSVCCREPRTPLALRGVVAKGGKKSSRTVGHKTYSEFLVVCVAPNTSAVRLLACALCTCIRVGSACGNVPVFFSSLCSPVGSLVAVGYLRWRHLFGSGTGESAYETNNLLVLGAVFWCKRFSMVALLGLAQTCFPHSLCRN